jgi:hypothetical protein
MSEPSITGLRADIVPHRQWAVSKWFYANPIWFYHRRGTDEQVVPDRTFYQLVDPELRPLCKALHQVDLHTTPSCQGHFYGRERFEQIWHELQREAMVIRNAGLLVRDSETQAPYRFADAQYQLPWPSFDSFYGRAHTHQGTGYIGILFRPDQDELADRLGMIVPERGPVEIGFDAETGRMLGGRLLAILTHPREGGEIPPLWASITRQVQRALAEMGHQIQAASVNRPA